MISKLFSKVSAWLERKGCVIGKAKGKRFFLVSPSNRSVTVELGFGKEVSRLSLEFYLSDSCDNTVGFSFAVPYVLSFNIHFDCCCDNMKYLTGDRCCRVFGFYVCKTHTCLSWYHDEMDSSNNKMWYSGHAGILHERLLKGKPVTRQTTGSEVTISISLPATKWGYSEIRVPITVQKQINTRTYPRWFAYREIVWNVIVVQDPRSYVPAELLAALPKAISYRRNEATDHAEVAELYRAWVIRSNRDIY